MTGIAWSDIAFAMRDDADDGAEEIRRLQALLAGVGGEAMSIGEVDGYHPGRP
ncbi:hypothetical protein [Candidatus Rariloculus sp.]|uniref:hypothetical protein n=1 Tax=Candidatus Rariloculus sp. TaxID=3101265 RepID=UPI003D0A7904